MSLKKILIVDDHEAVRSGIRALLASQSKWRICGEAVDGLEAIEKAKSLRPDIILMDVSMPRMDGVEATRIIRREIPDIDVIIISQNDPGLMQEAAVHVGAKGFIQKSKLARDLFSTLEKVAGTNGRKSPPNLHDSEAAGPNRTISDTDVAADGSSSAAVVSPSWQAGSGEMAELIRKADWARTPLGPASLWSPALRMIVNFLLANRFPQLLWWGPEFCCIYNDAYIPILGTKHPWALGRPVSEVWSEIWPILKPLIETPFSGGPATWMEDIPLEINRRGFFEETHFTIAYSPVPDESVQSGIGGVLATVHEITEKVVGERRVRALRDLGARSVEPKSEEEARVIVRETLSPHSKDIPFLLLYLLDEKQRNARLACRIGADQDDRGCPEFLDLSSPTAEEIWPLSKALETENIQLVEELKSRFDAVPHGPWSEPPHRAAVLPIRSNLQHQMAGFMVAGLSSRLEFDKSYRDFLELMSTQIATTVANARAYEVERKRAEALAEIDRAKTLFFSNVSHELRTPLTLMLGPLEDTLANDALGPQQRERLTLAHRNSLRLLKLVNALLDFSRIEAGRMKASYEPTDLAAFTAELASVFRAAIERAGMRLVIDCPPVSESVYVDREMWEKIVFNLLSNAFKYTFAGEIAVTLREIDVGVELAVRDTGAGIAARHLPHLFERFYRVEGAQGRTIEGSGIGLALVQELAKLHGGAVRAESELSQGSTFIVRIPLGKAHLPSDRISTASTTIDAEVYAQEALRWLPGAEISDAIGLEILPAEAESVPEASLDSQTKSRILLADDNADMREYVRRLLRGQYEVEALADGESALNSARERRPDLILSDIMMPNLDGVGLLRAVRSDEALKNIPVILLSARAGEESRVEGLESGADDYLVKPFSARELRACVRSHLELAQIRQESQNLERNLRLDAERLAAIVASSDDAIVSKTLDGIITSWNQGAERIFGYSANEAIGRHITLIIPEERREEEVKIIERLRRGERIDHFQTVRLCKDGTTVDVSLTISPMKDSSGRVIGASKIARDITAEKRAAERERQIMAEAMAAQAKFRAVFEQTTVFAGIMSNEGFLVEANKLCLEACGYHADDVLGKPFWDTGWWRNHPEARDKIRAAVPQAAQGICFREILNYSWADGTERLVDFALYPILDDKGDVLFLHPTGVDITDLKRAEENYRTLADNISQIAWMADPSGWVFWYNRRWFEFTGMTAEEMKLLGGEKVHHPEHRARVLEKFQKHIASGEEWEDTFPLRGRNGDYRWFLSRAVPIRDSAGKITRWFGTNTDITELRDAEEALRKSKEFTENQVRVRTRELEQRNREVTTQAEQLRLLSQRLLRTQDEERRHIARELHDSAGQTLTVLSIGLAQLAQKAARSAPQLATDAELIEETVRQLHREIRTTSYLLHPPLLDEAGLSSALNWYIKGLVERSGLDIRLYFSEEFERLPRDLELLVFRLVQECLTNIHRHSGSKTASIRIHREVDRVTIEIRDQGKGMTPQKLAEIQSYGSGVGIRGMRERLSQFDGNLKIESDAAGTRVLISIPLSEEASGEEPLQAAV